MVLGQIKDLFFRRMQFLRGELPEAYSYDIPRQVRHKIVGNILDNRIEIEQRGFCQGYDEMHEFVITLERQFGRSISNESSSSSKINAFLFSCNTDEFLSSIEVLLAMKLKNLKDRSDYYDSIKSSLSFLIPEINKIFKIEKIGYEIVSVGIENLPFMVVPFNSNYLYLETIKLPRELLHDAGFEGALQEFGGALQEFRNNEYKDCVLKAAKAYESTLKSILDKCALKYPPDANVPKLIDILLDSGKIAPKYLDDSLKSVWQVLKSGVPTIRNKEAGHGQGLTVKGLQKSYAELALHLSGTYIVFLVTRYREMNS